MGNAQPDTSFNAQPYVRPGITQEEVLGLRNVFLSLDPQVPTLLTTRMGSSRRPP